MESPRSRLVTWSCAHLSFLGRRFWRPPPDLDRSAAPALPPGGGRPFPGVGSGCSHAVRAASPQAPQRCQPGGPSPRTPTFDGWGSLVAAGGAIGAAPHCHGGLLAGRSTWAESAPTAGGAV